MKLNLIIILLCTFGVLTGCSKKEAEKSVLLTGNYSVEYTGTVLGKDTIVEDFTVTAGKSNEYAVPLRLSWINTWDSSGEYFFVSYRLERMGGPDEVKISGVNAMLLNEGFTVLKWEGADTRRFQEILITGNISVPGYTSNGHILVRFNSLGESYFD
jgi:hypothetical protein